jgi:hypothetical protein
MIASTQLKKGLQPAARVCVRIIADGDLQFDSENFTTKNHLQRSVSTTCF